MGLRKFNDDLDLLKTQRLNIAKFQAQDFKAIQDRKKTTFRRIITPLPDYPALLTTPEHLHENMTKRIHMAFVIVNQL